MLLLIALATVFGLYLTGRQWDSFLGQFPHWLSTEGAIAFALTLSAVKVAHEFGHAYVAKSFGCRVPTMGLALLVMWPTLFSDTTDAHRLTARRSRLAIAGAGILTELAIAGIATFLWSFLPDGPARSVSFLVATTTWITTLAVNLSPFMRFDGYYLLSDWLGIANLQSRSFALARHALRRLLFGFSDPAPEALPTRTHHIMIAYAIATWLYRLIVFTGIAVLVYSACFKLLGLVLFAIEIIYFILRPITQELAEWVFRFADHSTNHPPISTRVLFSSGIAASAFVAIALPWQGTISAPAVLKAASFEALYPPQAAQIVTISAHPGPVAAGEILFRLSSPDLAHRLEIEALKERAAQVQLDRMPASPESRDASAVLLEQIEAARVAQAGLRAAQARLTVTAPFAGIYTDCPTDLHAGQFIASTQPLGRVYAPAVAEVRGYVAAEDADRLTIGAGGVLPAGDSSQPSIPVTLTALAPVTASSLDLPALASVFGGPIAVRPTSDAAARLLPVSPIIAATFATTTAAPAQSTTGTIRLTAARHSLIGPFLSAAAAPLIRESGF